jgi:undecaprenyl-diphosphatase
MRLLIELVQYGLVVALVVPALHFAFGAYARHRRPGWSATFERRRLAILVLLVCVVAAIQVGEDVLDGDTGPIDEAILRFLHENVSGPFIAFFEAFTLTGSSKVLAPLTAAGAIGLVVARRRFEAILLAASSIVGGLLVYAIKGLVQRERPQLWETASYWGTSFPSGHTLAVAAFATAAALCVARIRPALGPVAIAIAAGWVALVALSRLVLGVHWPTDVLVAACIGAAVPLTISVAHELHVGAPGGAGR